MNDRKVVIVGTGFHKHINNKGPETELSCWKKLFRAICCKNDISHEVLNDDYVMSWESMILDLAKKENFKNPIFQVEKRLKKSLCGILKEQENTLVGNTKNDSLEEIRSSVKKNNICLISMNYDRVIYPEKLTLNHPYQYADEEKKKAIRSRFKSGKSLRNADIENLYSRGIVKGDHATSTIWHPHGELSKPNNIVIGMRDYGFLPPSYYYAFNRFKNWERKVIREKHLKDASNEEKYRCMLTAMESIEDGSYKDEISFHADNWVTRFMLYPVSIIGLSLSNFEIGLRWLLVQKTRNQARAKEAKKPAFHCFNKSQNDHSLYDIHPLNEHMGYVWNSIFHVSKK
jgi:hypothetical protein